MTDFQKADRICTTASIGTVQGNSSNILNEQRVKTAERIT